MGKRIYTNAAVYCRVSTQKEEQRDSIEAQQIDGKTAVKRLGCKKITVFVDRGSGTTDKRQGYQQMLSGVKKGLFDVVITKDISRLNRSSLDWNVFLRASMDNDVGIYFYIENRFYETRDKMISVINAAAAEKFSIDLSEKSNLAHQRRQNYGISAIFTNNVWGYKTVYNEDGSKRLVIDKEEAKMIELIFQFAIEGNGVHSISKKLYDMGYKNHNGRPFGNSVILGIIRNPKVTGDIIVNKSHYDFDKKRTIKRERNDWIYNSDVVPAIIDKATFRLANEILNDRAKVYNCGNKGGVYKGKYKLSGKIVCGYCGASYRRSSRKVSTETIYEWYCSTYSKLGRKTVNQYKRNNCNSDGNKDGCDNIRIKESTILQILDKIASEYFNEDNQNKLLNQAMGILNQVLKKSNRMNDVDNEQKALKKQILEIQRKEDLLLNKLMDGIIQDEVYQRNQERYTSERVSLNDRLSKLEKMQSDKQSLNERLAKIEDTLSGGGMKQITVDVLLEYINRIVVYMDRLEIEINLSKIIGSSLEDWIDSDIITISEPLAIYKQGYCESSMNATKEMVYQAICENTKIHLDEIVEVTGLAKSMVNARIRTLKAEGRIQSKGARDTFRWIIS